jgi:hypothetical protein
VVRVGVGLAVRVGVGLAVRVGVGLAVRVGVGLAVRVGVALVGGVAPLQATLFTVNAVGLLNEPLHVPWKPISVDEPVGRLPFHDMLVAVRAVPEAVQLADQPELSACPAGRVNRRVQAVIGSPGLEILMVVVKPPLPGLCCQLFGV